MERPQPMTRLPLAKSEAPPVEKVEEVALNSPTPDVEADETGSPQLARAEWQLMQAAQRGGANIKWLSKAM